MTKKIDSLKHEKDKRALIPSREEAGMEEASEAAQREEARYSLNPIVHRGQDPELFWLNKYGEDDKQEDIAVDIRSLYRHEHIPPEKLIQRLYKLKRENEAQGDMFVEELFGNYKDIDELDKAERYYKHSDNWSNRLIQGDSLLVMASLLEREGMAGQVQMIYLDPPYGIKYGSNWQMKLNDRNVKDGDDTSLTGEPEVIKAFRDTWEFGIHSYLSYLRERLLVARELLTESGSCFVQISDENVHLVRCLMDEVFGSGNFVGQITFFKTTSQTAENIASTTDYLVWYAKNIEQIKYQQLYLDKSVETDKAGVYTWIELPDGFRRRMSRDEKEGKVALPEGGKIFRLDNMTSQSGGSTTNFPVEFDGKILTSGKGFWKTNEAGVIRLKEKRRVTPSGNTLAYIRYLDDFPVYPIANLWIDTGTGSFTDDKKYVVQTGAKVVQRCILMTTAPGDLILDPTCGSGTTAYVAEQWGRRWITIDTSRIALNIAKTRLMTATFLWYTLADEKAGKPDKEWNVRNGFIYKKVPHVTLKSLANDEPSEDVTLYDQPEIDKKKLRVAGPFTVDTLQSHDILPPETLSDISEQSESLQNFTQQVFEHLKSAGVKNGIRNETAVFARLSPLGGDVLHAEGFYDTTDGERKAYFHIGPQFGAVSKTAVNHAIRDCRAKGDGDWLVILGFAFESDIENKSISQKAGAFEVTKVRMHDDLLQEGLLKKDKKAASFVTIGEPDIGMKREGENSIVEICGLDIYDPIRNEVKARSVADIAYWMVDDNYDGANFMVRQVFFCGGDKDEFAKWQKGLSDLAKQSTKRKVEKTLKIEIDDEAFDRIYGFRSHPIPFVKGKKVAVRVISQFGEESTKILVL